MTAEHDFTAALDWHRLAAKYPEGLWWRWQRAALESLEAARPSEGDDE